MLKLKRAYEGASRADGTQIFVERLWPRGLSKAKLHVKAWRKEVGPSTKLRKRFSHDPEKWRRFRTRYFRELNARPEVWRPMLSAARRRTVTLVCRSHDAQHNNAIALQKCLQAKMRGQATSTRAVAVHRSRPSSR